MIHPPVKPDPPHYIASDWGWSANVNAALKREYQRALSDYYAQLEYYKSITAEHIPTPGLSLLARADLLLQTARTSENDLRDLATELRDELRRCANLVDRG